MAATTSTTTAMMPHWWHQNDPDFFSANRPQWISWQPDWRDQDGAYDSYDNWHYGQGCYNQNPTWVFSNHPNWISQHQNWAMRDHPAVMRTDSEGSQQNRHQQSLGEQQNRQQHVDRQQPN
jgi:hypothetical protein